MSFDEEQTQYDKTILSDLQGAWTALRDAVLAAFGFDGSDRAIFHIDEAMSWEVVRNFKRMEPLLAKIGNICARAEADEDILKNVERVDQILKKAVSEVSVRKKGSIH